MASAEVLDERNGSRRSSRACSSGSAAAAATAAPAAPRRRRRRAARAPRRARTSRAAPTASTPDADQAAKAARRAFEPNERLPVATAREDGRGDAQGRRSPTTRRSSRYAVEETGLGRYEDKLDEEQARREQDAGHRDPAPGRVHRRRRPDAHRARAVRRDARGHADHEPDRDDPLQRDRHGRGRQRGRVQRPSVGGADLATGSSTCSTRRSRPRAARAT